MSQTDGYLLKLVKDELVMLKGVGYKLSSELVDSTFDKYAKKHAYLLKDMDTAEEKAKLYELFQIQKD